jgi:hypothetical protein
MVANALDSNSQSGQQGSPTPDNLANESVQPPSTNAPASSLEQMRTFVNEAVREALRDPKVYTSIKDKRIGAIEQQLKDASPVLERVRKLLTPEQEAQFAQIQRDAVIDQLQQAVFGDSQTQTGAPQGGTPGSAALELQAIDEVLELPANDSRVTDLKLKYRGDPLAYGREAKKLKASFNQNPATPAEQLLPEGGGASRMSEAEIDTDLARYTELNKNRTQNSAAIAVLETRLRKAGVIA